MVLIIKLTCWLVLIILICCLVLFVTLVFCHLVFIVGHSAWSYAIRATLFILLVSLLNLGQVAKPTMLPGRPCQKVLIVFVRHLVFIVHHSIA